MKKIFFLTLFVIFIIIIGSPFYTVYNIKNNYENQDVTSFSQNIDYKKLASNIKSDLHKDFSITLDKIPIIKQLGGSSLVNSGKTMMSIAVNNAITQKNIEAMLINPQHMSFESKQFLVAWALATNKLDFKYVIKDILVTKGNLKKLTKKQLKYIKSEVLQLSTQDGIDRKNKLNYCGIHCFSVKTLAKGFPIEMVLERQGLLDWKVVHVKLP